MSIQKKQKIDVSLVRQEAMPEVKKLVKKFGRTNIAWCIAQLHEYEKKLDRLASLRKEAAKLKKELS